jgi:hypothetical protein
MNLPGRASVRRPYNLLLVFEIPPVYFIAAASDALKISLDSSDRTPRLHIMNLMKDGRLGGNTGLPPHRTRPLTGSPP